MPRWTDEAREAQRQIMKERQAWKKSTGPRTDAGKAASSANALKHGGRSALAEKLRALFALAGAQRRIIEARNSCSRTPAETPWAG